MAKITKQSLKNAVYDAVASDPSATPAQIATAVTSDPSVAPALKPVSRFKSQVIQGITAAGLAQIAQQTGLSDSLVIVANWLGFHPDPVQFGTVFTTVITLAGLVLAWIGRETTTRPLA